MNVGFYTSKHYFDSKRQALEEAAKKLGLEINIVIDESLHRPSAAQQAFGFEELFKRTKEYAAETLKHPDIEVGIAVENALAYIYSSNEWYYVICVALRTRDGRETASFTPGISVPLWMVKEVQDNNIKLDALTQRLAGEDDPVVYFSGKTLTRQDLMIPALLLAFSALSLEKHT
jgi:non-canonical (house-cleaning) NTP pyrophosphatase